MTRTRGATVVAVAASLAVAGSFLLPWARSGRAERSGFALARAVDTLGLADTAVLRALLVGVWLCPMAAAGAWTAALLGRRLLTAALAAGTGAVAVAASALMFRAESVETLVGPRAGIVAGGTAVAAGVVLAVTRGLHDT